VIGAGLLSALLCLPAAASAAELIAHIQDAAGRSVEDAVFFVQGASDEPFTPPFEPLMVDQIDKQFVPRVLPVLAGSKVSFPNKEKIHHHIYSFSKAKRFELPLYKDTSPEPVVMDKPGVVKLGCNIHDGMLGYILVLDNPHFAKTKSNGRARLALPPGEYQVAAWSERLKGPVEDTLQKITVGDEDVRLKFKLELTPAPKVRRQNAY